PASAALFPYTTLFRSIITVQSTGFVGNCSRDDGSSEDEEDDESGGIGRCTRVRIRSVLNFENRWTPPPPNAGAMPTLGIAPALGDRKSTRLNSSHVKI